MTPAETELAMFAIETIAKRGLPVFMKAMRTLEGDEPSLDDIKALKDRVKRPEEYFGNQGTGR